MRKKILKVLSFVFVVAVLLTGCATVSDIKNDQTDLIFNGGNVVKVGDYVYFANGYTAVGSGSDFDYDKNVEVSYLNRVNLNAGFTSPDNSPKKNEKVNSRVVGFESEYMFVLGDYIYFSSVNTHKNKQVENDYSLVSYFRSRLNGDNLTELYTTNSYNASTAVTRVLKGSDNNYHLVIFDGTNLNSIKIGDNIGKRQELATNVTSLAMPHEKDNFEYKEILYTVNKENSSNETEVYSVDYATGEKEKATSTSSTTKFVDRQGDVVFYTHDAIGISQTYYKRVSSGTSLIFDASEFFYRLTDIKNMQLVCAGDDDKEGYVFLGKSGSIMYKNMVRTGEQATTLLDKSVTDFSNMLFVEGEWVYYSTTKGIYRISASDGEKQTIVEMQNEIEPSTCAYVDNYIYYYAKLEPIENEDGKEYEEDSNFYAYRVDVSGHGNYQILSNFKRVEKKA